MSNNSKTTIDEKKTLNGRIVHDVPMSLLNKPKPSDKPTKKLDDNQNCVSQSEEQNFNAEDQVMDSASTPGTTVLGLDMEDFSSDNELNEPQKLEDAKPEKVVVEKPKTAAKSESQKKRAPRNANLFLVRKLNGDEVKITKKDFIIGKSKYSDFQVKGNNTVSRSHIIAHKQMDGSLTIEDNDSKNGTFIDEKQIAAHEEIELHEGQVVRISDEVFEVKKR